MRSQHKVQCLLNRTNFNAGLFYHLTLDPAV